MYAGDKLVVADKILRRRLQLLVHSCIYYNLDDNIVTDKKWNDWSNELIQLQANYPEISSTVDWYDAFKDWDGSTGAFLPLDNEWVVNTATRLLKNKNKNLKPIACMPIQSVATVTKPAKRKSRKLF